MPQHDPLSGARVRDKSAGSSSRRPSLAPRLATSDPRSSWHILTLHPILSRLEDARASVSPSSLRLLVMYGLPALGALLLFVCLSLLHGLAQSGRGLLRRQSCFLRGLRQLLAKSLAFFRSTLQSCNNAVSESFFSSKSFKHCASAEASRLRRAAHAALTDASTQSWCCQKSRRLSQSLINRLLHHSDEASRTARDASALISLSRPKTSRQREQRHSASHRACGNTTPLREHVAPRKQHPEMERRPRLTAACGRRSYIITGVHCRSKRL